MARLAASRLQRQVTGNPLVSVFLQVRNMRGRVEDGVMILTLDRAEESPADTLAGNVLDSAVADAVLGATKLYDAGGLLIQEIRLENAGGDEIWQKPLAELKPSVESQKE
jgi:hypothetical protein